MSNSDTLGMSDSRIRRVGREKTCTEGNRHSPPSGISIIASSNLIWLIAPHIVNNLTGKHITWTFSSNRTATEAKFCWLQMNFAGKLPIVVIIILGWRSLLGSLFFDYICRLFYCKTNVKGLATCRTVIVSSGGSRR